MKAYTAIGPDGTKHWLGTQLEAKAISKDFEQAEIPTGKDELLAFVNNMQQVIDSQRARLRQLASVSPPAASAPVEAPAPPPAPPPAPAPQPEQKDPMDRITLTALPKLVQMIVERTGELGDDAFDAIDRHLGVGGVGESFSRGAGIIFALSLGEHQFQRMLMRRRKKFGEKA